ncbi:hypothetical protein F4781DRAFT_236375 [Annulohypoxylon bovei var. microspora]|nr:hypothetical protein F4781DRAFT_236375 [Annulohypoxylon bovei var. microspora]
MSEMELKDQRSPISTLSNELLLSIFESELPPSTLLQCMLCCKRWSPLSSSVLYKHLALTTDTLSRFVSCPSSKDALVETFTLRIIPVRSPEAENIIRQLQSNLDELTSRLAKMVNLQSFSLFAPSKLPSSHWVPDTSIAVILSSLPQTCVCLELNVKYLPHVGIVDGDEEVHLCASIRQMIPRLRFLRLNLPKICPEAFGFGFDRAQPSVVATDFKSVEAPHLKKCLIKIAEPRHTFGLERSPVCGCPNANIVTVLANHLQVFKAPSNAPVLERLWIADVSPTTDLYSTFHAFVRRDILAEKSQFLPYKNIGLHKFNKEGIFIRMPAEEGGEDLVSTIEGVMSLAEQHAWVETIHGTRIPSAEISKRHSLALAKPVIRTADEWFAKTNITCMLWADEEKTATRLLDATEEGLTEDSTMTLRIPDGWTRPEGGFLRKL